MTATVGNGSTIVSLRTAKVTIADVPHVPRASAAFAKIVCVPSATAFEFQVARHGASPSQATST